MRNGQVKALREKLELTQEQFAALVGVHRITVSQWETGTHAPSRMAVKTLRRLAKRRGVEWEVVQ